MTQGQTTESQGAGEEAARKARAAEQRRDEEARFRQDKSEILDSLKGLDDSGVEVPAGPAVEQLKNDAAWSGSAAGSQSEGKAREEAEHGAQGRGGIKHLPVGKIPEVPAPERVPE